MRKVILGLIAASALGCAAVNDGRLETAVDNAEPIALVRGERHDAVIGIVETPEGICNGEAEAILFPEGMGIDCGDYHFVHTEWEWGGVGADHYPSRFLYNTNEGGDIVSWAWNPFCNRWLIANHTYENDSQGRSRRLQEVWFEDSCGGVAAHYHSELGVDHYGIGHFSPDRTSPLTFERDATAEDNQRYQSILQQMNAQEGERLWIDWKHTVLGDYGY